MKTLLGEYDGVAAKAMQRGIVHEKTAVAKYEAETGTVFNPSGLWLHPLGFVAVFQMALLTVQS